MIFGASMVNTMKVIRLFHDDPCSIVGSYNPKMEKKEKHYWHQKLITFHHHHRIIFEQKVYLYYISL